MSSAGHDRYYASLSKSRRSSPGESQGSVFFQTGQGGRTVLPPLSSAFPTSRFPVPAYPNQYTQPRSSPGRYELNPQALYNQWPASTSPHTSSFSNYETHERYPHQAQYTYYPSRTPPISSQLDSRKLPPLSTNAGAGWQTAPSYIPTSSNYTSTGSIRSPTASYPATYDYPTSGPGPAYTYHMPTQEYDHPHVPSMTPQGHITTYEGLDGSRRSSSPYSKRSSQVSPPVYVTPPPISPTSPEESTIKKKRKRADAAQLKVLNETYNRTAFPSTEERLELAKALDMSARSVQIWFQNKRQSMRQTNRQSSATSSSAQPYTMAGPESVMDDLVEHVSMNYGGSMPTDNMRSHISHPTSSHRRRGQEEAADPRKWSRGY